MLPGPGGGGAPGRAPGRRPSLRTPAGPYPLTWKARGRPRSRRPCRGPALQPRGKRADQVAQDRRLVEDRRGAKRVHGDDSMTIIRAAFAAGVALCLLAVPLAAFAQQQGRIPRNVGNSTRKLPLLVDRLRLDYSRSRIRLQIDDLEGGRYLAIPRIEPSGSPSSVSPPPVSSSVRT